MSHLTRAVVSAAVLLLAGVGAAAAEHDRVRRAFEAGEVAGLGGILARVESAYEGRVLAIELDERRGPGRRAPWVYAIRVLTPGGHVLVLRVDARTMEILAVEGRAPARQPR